MTSEFVLLSRFPSFQPARFELPEGMTTVGRSSSCDFVIRNETVSRQHAEIHIQGKTATVRDLGSSNGTLVNGLRINSSPLLVGQHLQFGQVGFLVSSPDKYDFEFDSTEETRKAPGAEKTESHTSSTHAYLLTPGQRRVLEMLLQGMSEKEVAIALKLKPNTVHTHIREIYRACGVHSRAELLALFVKRDDDIGKSTG